MLATVMLATVPLAAGACSSTSPADIARSSAASSGSAPHSLESSVTASASPVCGSAELAALSLRDKLAQMLVVGVTGPADARAVVAGSHVGGIFLGSWTDMSILANGRLRAISASAPTPLMVTVDEEGGRVSRLGALGIDMPPARRLASTATTGQVRSRARDMGVKMRAVGITVDFAPDIDVSDEPADEVIGDRSFSDDPAVVARYGAAFAAGLRDAGIMPVFKHFPGHGHGSGDSHTGSVTTPPLAVLKNSDLLPYRTLLGPGLGVPGSGVPGSGVMVGHLVVPGLTGPQTPASVSPAAMSLLRNGVGYGGKRFDGPIFTDDLSGMAAITSRFGITEAVTRAISAGADIALWLSTTQVPAVLDALSAAVSSGRLSRAAVDASVLRILRAKGVLRCREGAPSTELTHR